MATGHWNPGYGNMVTRSHHARSAGAGLPSAVALQRLQSTAQLADGSLESIRQQARQAWTKSGMMETSYHDHYKNKTGQVGSYTEARPTSAHRRNKPHPPLVFLTCRLHTVPGYHNPDATLGKDPYTVDAMLSPEEQIARSGLRRKYAAGRPSTAAVMQYGQQEGEREFAPEAAYVDMPDIWRPQMTTPSTGNRERERMRSVLGHLDEDQRYEYEPPLIASHHRYLRPAGFQETVNLMDCGRTLSGMRFRDIERMRNARAPNQSQRTRRGDFLMHPEWRPSLPHHRLNGLSSVDIPYSQGR